MANTSNIFTALAGFFILTFMLSGDFVLSCNIRSSSCSVDSTRKENKPVEVNILRDAETTHSGPADTGDSAIDGAPASVPVFHGPVGADKFGNDTATTPSDINSANARNVIASPDNAVHRNDSLGDTILHWLDSDFVNRSAPLAHVNSTNPSTSTGSGVLVLPEPAETVNFRNDAVTNSSDTNSTNARNLVDVTTRNNFALGKDSISTGSVAIINLKDNSAIPKPHSKSTNPSAVTGLTKDGEIEVDFNNNVIVGDDGVTAKSSAVISGFNFLSSTTSTSTGTAPVTATTTTSPGGVTHPSASN